MFLFFWIMELIRDQYKMWQGTHRLRQVKEIITVTANQTKRRSKYLATFQSSRMSNLCPDYLFDYLLTKLERAQPGTPYLWAFQPIKNGSKGARTPGLSRVRRTLIPAELCFHVYYFNTVLKKCNRKKQKIRKYFFCPIPI